VWGDLLSQSVKERLKEFPEIFTCHKKAQTFFVLKIKSKFFIALASKKK